MFLSTALGGQPPSSGQFSILMFVLVLVSVPYVGSGGSTTFFRWVFVFLCCCPLILLFQPVCPKLDKLGARQQLGTQGIWFSSQRKILLKVKDTLKMLPWGVKVTHYLVEVDMPSKSFEGTEEEYRYMRMLKVWIPNIADDFRKYPSMWGITPTFVLLRNVCFRSYIDKPTSLGRQFDLIIGGTNL